MKRKFSMAFMVVLVLLSFAVSAAAETTLPRVFVKPTIVYDGTILDIAVQCTPAEGNVTLVDALRFMPNADGADMVDAAIARGEDVIGLLFDAALYADNTKLSERRVFYDRVNDQSDQSFTRGFYCLLLPEMPREGLTAQIDVVTKSPDSDATDSYPTISVPISKSATAETFTIPVNLKMRSARVDQVFVSQSSVALCVFLHAEGPSYYGEPAMIQVGENRHTALLELNEDNGSSSMRWTMFVFEPLQNTEDTLALILLGDPASGDEATLQIDLLKKRVDLVSSTPQ